MEFSIREASLAILAMWQLKMSCRLSNSICSYYIILMPGLAMSKTRGKDVKIKIMNEHNTAHLWLPLKKNHKAPKYTVIKIIIYNTQLLLYLLIIDR